MCFTFAPYPSLKIADYLEAQLDQQMLQWFQRKMQQKPQEFKGKDAQGSVYPRYFAPVVVSTEERERIIRPMRYRLRPHNVKANELAKYSLYNARSESLKRSPIWSPLLGKHHCLVPLQSFREWVERDGKKQLIRFGKPNGTPLLALGLYDYWRAKHTDDSFLSFAIITKEPPAVVAKAGHDRCPIFIKKDFVDSWLQASSPEQLDQSLDHLDQEIEELSP
jgi:putative SOS response-associated peptidase YedK